MSLLVLNRLVNLGVFILKFEFIGINRYCLYFNNGFIFINIYLFLYNLKCILYYINKWYSNVDIIIFNTIDSFSYLIKRYSVKLNCCYINAPFKKGAFINMFVNYTSLFYNYYYNNINNKKLFIYIGKYSKSLFLSLSKYKLYLVVITDTYIFDNISNIKFNYLFINLSKFSIKFVLKQILFYLKFIKLNLILSYKFIFSSIYSINFLGSICNFYFNKSLEFLIRKNYFNLKLISIIINNKLLKCNVNTILLKLVNFYREKFNIIGITIIPFNILNSWVLYKNYTICLVKFFNLRCKFFVCYLIVNLYFKKFINLYVFNSCILFDFLFHGFFCIKNLYLYQLI